MGRRTDVPADCHWCDGARLDAYLQQGATSRAEHLSVLSQGEFTANIDE